MGGDWKEMVQAIEEGDLNLVKYYIRMGVDINYQHPEFLTTPLLESLRFGRIEIAKLLLENGADPNKKEDMGPDTPLSVAKASKNREAIQLIQSYQMKMPAPTPTGPPRTVLITGGNRGIGKAVAQSLLEKGQNVIIVSRNLQSGEAVAAELKEATHNSNITVLQGDLGSIQGCHALVQKIKSAHSDIDTLINNAGIWMTSKELNEDQLEMSFMVNYIAPYILCKELLPVLQQNKPSRIVNVNAGLYIKGKLDIDKTPTGLDFSAIKTYANTKLCNVMFTIDFAKEIEGSGVSINAVHPGVIKTGLGDSPKLLSKIVKFFKRFWKSPEYGAEAPVWLALSEELEGVHGMYYNEKEIMEYIDVVKDEAARKALREKTEEILKAKVMS